MNLTFPVIWCSSCDRDVLLTHDLHEDELVTRCIHCEAIHREDQARAVEAAELVELGYVVEGQESSHGERGCRDGQCGVRQP